MNKPQRPTSSLAQAALELEEAFAQFERLSGQLEEVAINSDAGLIQAQKILAKFGEYGEKIAANMQLLSTTLESARARAEKAAVLVTNKAALVQARKIETQAILDRFLQLKDMVAKVTAVIGELNQLKKNKTAQDEINLLQERLPELDTQLEILLEESRKIRQSAQDAHMNSLQKNAATLAQGVQAARRQLKEFSRSTLQ